jgi:hypothetical protein
MDESGGPSPSSSLENLPQSNAHNSLEFLYALCTHLLATMIGWLAPLFCRCADFVFGPHDDHSARRWRNHPLQLLEQRLLSFIHRPCKVVPKVAPNTRGMRVSRHIKMHANTPTTYPPGEWWSNGSPSIDAPPPRPRNTGHTGYLVWIACFF